MKSRKFGELLTNGLYAIQRIESNHSKKKKTLGVIQKELGDAIGRKPSTIDWFRRGNFPTSLVELEQLAEQMLTRGQLGREWLEDFLRSADHPYPSEFCDKVLIPDTNKSEASQNYIYKRTKVHYFKRLMSDGCSEILREIEIEVTSDNPLSVIRHRKTTSTVPIEPFDIKLCEGIREDGGKIDLRVLSKHDHICVWAIEFTPPLIKGQRASYTCKTLERSDSLTFEETYKQYKDGIRRNDFEHWGILISAPTDDFKMEIVFPVKYAISLPSTGGFGVYAGWNEQLDEKTRLIANNCFTAKFDNKLQQWMLKLHVSHPYLGRDYQLQWTPPYNKT